MHPVPKHPSISPQLSSLTNTPMPDFLNQLPRTCTFSPNPSVVDDKIIDHKHRIHDHFLNRKRKVSSRELGNLKLLAKLERVQWGFWKEDPACLVGFRFQFQGSTPSWRFEKADIRISFSGPDPVVVDYGPKHLSSSTTDEQKKKYLNATLAAKTPLVTPSLTAGIESSYAAHTASTVEAADFTEHGKTEPTVVKYWLREDEKQGDGILLDFDCAVIVKRSDGFNANVDVKVGPVFDWLATPWPCDDPVIFDPSIPYGEEIRSVPNLDFATLTQEEWARLVTPNLKFEERLHSESSKSVVGDGH